MLKSYKTEINPTQEQIQKINKTIGTCRFIYNFYIAHNKELYNKGEKFMTAKSFSVWLNNEFIITRKLSNVIFEPRGEWYVKYIIWLEKMIWQSGKTDILRQRGRIGKCSWLEISESERVCGIETYRCRYSPTWRNKCKGRELL